MRPDAGGRASFLYQVTASAFAQGSPALVAIRNGRRALVYPGIQMRPAVTSSVSAGSGSGSRELVKNARPL